jgi:hypothetical protein
MHACLPGLLPAQEGREGLQLPLVRLVAHAPASGFLQGLQEALLRGHGLQAAGRHAHVVVVLHSVEVAALFFHARVRAGAGAAGHAHGQARRRGQVRVVSAQMLHVLRRLRGWRPKRHHPLLLLVLLLLVVRLLQMMRSVRQLRLHHR